MKSWGSQNTTSRKDCDEYVQGLFPQAKWTSEGPCYDTSLSLSGTLNFYELELRAFAAAAEKVTAKGRKATMHLLDAMALSAEHCDLTQDGRHFPKLSVAMLHAIAAGIGGERE